MDYFYVRNHANSVGLVDINANFKYEKDKFFVIVASHIFSSTANVVDGFNEKTSNNLGTEIDLVFGNKIENNIKLQVGYSQIFMFNPKWFSHKKDID